MLVKLSQNETHLSLMRTLINFKHMCENTIVSIASYTRVTGYKIKRYRVQDGQMKPPPPHHHQRKLFETTECFPEKEKFIRNLSIINICL